MFRNKLRIVRLGRESRAMSNNKSSCAKWQEMEIEQNHCPQWRHRSASRDTKEIELSQQAAEQSALRSVNFQASRITQTIGDCSLYLTIASWDYEDDYANKMRPLPGTCYPIVRRLSRRCLLQPRAPEGTLETWTQIWMQMLRGGQQWDAGQALTCHTRYQIRWANTARGTNDAGSQGGINATVSGLSSQSTAASEASAELSQMQRLQLAIVQRRVRAVAASPERVSTDGWQQLPIQDQLQSCGARAEGVGILRHHAVALHAAEAIQPGGLRQAQRARRPSEGTSGNTALSSASRKSDNLHQNCAWHARMVWDGNPAHCCHFGYQHLWAEAAQWA